MTLSLLRSSHQWSPTNLCHRIIYTTKTLSRITSCVENPMMPSKHYSGIVTRRAGMSSSATRQGKKHSQLRFQKLLRTRTNQFLLIRSLGMGKVWQHNFWSQFQPAEKTNNPGIMKNWKQILRARMRQANWRKNRATELNSNKTPLTLKRIYSFRNQAQIMSLSLDLTLVNKIWFKANPRASKF